MTAFKYSTKVAQGTIDMMCITNVRMSHNLMIGFEEAALDMG